MENQQLLKQRAFISMEHFAHFLRTIYPKIKGREKFTSDKDYVCFLRSALGDIGRCEYHLLTSCVDDYYQWESRVLSLTGNTKKAMKDKISAIHSLIIYGKYYLGIKNPTVHKIK